MSNGLIMTYKPAIWHDAEVLQTTVGEGASGGPSSAVAYRLSLGASRAATCFFCHYRGHRLTGREHGHYVGIVANMYVYVLCYNWNCDCGGLGV